MDGLEIANRFWSNECRDKELCRLRRQKHAAHSQVYRLKHKIQEMQLAKRLLLLAYIASSHENERLRQQIRTYAQAQDYLSTL